MPNIHEVKVPDIGDFEEVDVIEVYVSAGDEVAKEDPLICLESEKASMDIPSPYAGTVKEVLVENGDKVSEGTPIAKVEAEGAGGETDEKPKKGEDGKEEKKPEKGDEEPAAKEDAPQKEEKPEREPVKKPEKERPAASTDERPKAPSDIVENADLHAEVVVIGSGPGGYTAAFRAADLGLKTVLVERYPVLGGVCLNVGCIPSKALLHVAEVVADVEGLRGHGVDFGEMKLDLDKLREHKEEIVGTLTGGLTKMAKGRKVKTVTGTAQFTSDHTLVVESEAVKQTIAFDQAIIAAGSQAVRLPFIPYDDPRVMDSTGALELTDVPERLLVIGGGIIGLEMAAVYDALGSKITVVELTPGLMPGTDPDLVRPLERRIKKRYENVFVDTKVTACEATDDGLQVSFEGKKAPESDTFDRVLVAVGRRPNGDKVGAEHAGVEVDDRGFIHTDNRQRTNVGHIFAIGDLTDGPQLAHKATHEGKVAAEVAYTVPEIAWMGLTETQAKEQGVEIEKGAFPWAASGRSLGMGNKEGTTKVLFDKETGRVVGAGMVGPRAGELIAEATLALEMGADATDLGLTIHPHPTLSETVAFAAEVAEGTVTDLYIPKKKK